VTEFLYDLFLQPDSINRCSAAPIDVSCVTQCSQSLALGLALAAAPQLVELQAQSAGA